MFLAGVRRMDPRRGSVQSDRIRSNRDAGEHHLYTDHHELRPLPGHLLSLKKHRGVKQAKRMIAGSWLLAFVFLPSLRSSSSCR
ncbi:hypothetical protein CEXT_431301 [Caerostris extrusa]|uniref:Uncharacterized protein n=1 Tax=Caerostris extrusa TaxID=172846 RepID=A0AAV4XG65_CAEEX|nr:hypothetical protein CEXT_431301 [Caerostris extrusa]